MKCGLTGCADHIPPERLARGAKYCKAGHRSLAYTRRSVRVNDDKVKKLRAECTCGAAERVFGT